MSLKDKLKSMFTYNGEEVEDSSKPYDSGALEKMSKNINLAFIKNPIHKAIVKKDEIKEKIIHRVKSKASLSRDTETLYFMGIFYATNPNKTFEEVRPLYDNFFNKNVVDESVYSTEDLIILKQATTYLKSIFSQKVDKGNYQSVLEDLSKSEFLLQMINMSDYNKGTNILGNILEYTYDIFDISYDYESLLHSKISVLALNGFYVSMLPELGKVINTLDSYDRKLSFLLGKISHLFVKVCILDDVDVTYLNVINSVMQNIPTDMRDMGTDYEKPELSIQQVNAPTEGIEFQPINIEVEKAPIVEKEDKQSSTSSEPERTKEDLTNMDGIVGAPAMFMDAISEMVDTKVDTEKIVNESSDNTTQAQQEKREEDIDMYRSTRQRALEEREMDDRRRNRMEGEMDDRREDRMEDGNDDSNYKIMDRDEFIALCDSVIEAGTSSYNDFKRLNDSIFDITNEYPDLVDKGNEALEKSGWQSKKY